MNCEITLDNIKKLKELTDIHNWYCEFKYKLDNRYNNITKRLYKLLEENFVYSDFLSEPRYIENNKFVIITSYKFIDRKFVYKRIKLTMDVFINNNIEEYINELTKHGKLNSIIYNEKE